MLHDSSEKLSVDKPLQDNPNLKFVDYNSHRIRLEVDIMTGHQGILVHADAWDSRWSARVNGQDARILRANIGSRAVVLDEGRNQIEFEFARGHPMVLLNKVVFSLTMFFVVFLCALSFREARIYRHFGRALTD